MKSLAPDRTTVVDAVLLLSLIALATLGLRETYTGWSFLGVAIIGALLGIVLSHITARLGLPILVVAASTVLVFFILGGAVALSGDDLGNILPLPSTLKTLAEQSVDGWKDLLTTLAPVDGGPLLTLPYLIGLVAGTVGMTLAARTRSPFWPLIAPVGYFAVVILLGIKFPARLVEVGAVFALVALGWVAVRARRTRGSWRSEPLRRNVVAVVLLAGTAAVAMVIGPNLPGAGARDRVVLRNYVSPPFDVGQYPTPLAGFRKYTKGYQPKDDADKLFNTELMTVTGLPQGSRLRFAALDSYDGVVWGASNQAPDTSGADGSFQRVGTQIRDVGVGTEQTATVTIAEGYSGVWLPTTGNLMELSFTGADAEDQSTFFRYNLATDTGVVPQGIGAGTSYTFTADVPSADDQVSPQLSPSAGGFSLNDSGIDFLPVAERWTPDSGGSIGGVLGVAEYLKDQGTYTDGGKGQEQYAAGHSLARLSTFSAEGSQIAGNDEQYAAMLGLLSNQLGVPARVVVGASVPADGVVKGKDVRAWIELRDVSGQWQELPTESFMNEIDNPPKDQPPVAETPVSGEIVPPPSPVKPPATAGDPLASDDNKRARTERPDTGGLFGWELPAWLVLLLKILAVPLLLAAAWIGLVLGFKAWRRRRRQSLPEPSERIAAGWSEALDVARDRGLVVSGFRTRREQARQIGVPGFVTLARTTDQRLFGDADPTELDADHCWTEVDAIRTELDADTTRWRRFRSRMSIRSLRRLPRWRPGDVEEPVADRAPAAPETSDTVGASA